MYCFRNITRWFRAVLVISMVLVLFPVEVQAVDLPSSGGSQMRQRIIETARRYLGVPYVWGGAGPSGFDSSGITWYTFQLNGIEIPRTHAEMFRKGIRISREQLLPGDIVFFETIRSGPSHGGLYIGSGQFLHSPSSGSVVKVSPLNTPYYASRYIGARRFIEESDIAVYVNGRKLELRDQSAFLSRNNRTMVPIRFITEALDGNVQWLQDSNGSGVVRIQSKHGTSMLYPGTRRISLNGTPTMMDVGTQILRGRTMVPLRVVAEGLGASVQWDVSSQSVRIWHRTSGVASQGA